MSVDAHIAAAVLVVALCLVFFVAMVFAVVDNGKK